MCCCIGKFLCLSLNLFVLLSGQQQQQLMQMQQQLPSCKQWTVMTLGGCGFYEWCSNQSIWSWVLGFCVMYTWTSLLYSGKTQPELSLSIWELTLGFVSRKYRVKSGGASSAWEWVLLLFLAYGICKLKVIFECVLCVSVYLVFPLATKEKIKVFWVCKYSLFTLRARVPWLTSKNILIHCRVYSYNNILVSMDWFSCHGW
jgi:hypothetical protein